MLDQKNGQAEIAAQLSDGIGQCSSFVGVHTCSGFVQQKQVRLGSHRTNDFQMSLFTVGQVLCLFELLVRQMEDVQQFFRFLERAKQMHLPDAGTPSVYALIDEDGDGYIDEPRMDRNRDGKIDPHCDLDGDGKIGNTSLKYEDFVNSENAKSGIAHPTSTVNLNEVKPPRYFKVINNRGGYRYQIMDTSCERISDGAWYRDKDEPDTLGGFFGATEFIYEEGKSLVGTENKNGITDTFYFTQEYYQMP